MAFQPFEQVAPGAAGQARGHRRAAHADRVQLRLAHRRARGRAGRPREGEHRGRARHGWGREPGGFHRGGGRTRAAGVPHRGHDTRTWGASCVVLSCAQAGHGGRGGFHQQGGHTRGQRAARDGHARGPARGHQPAARRPRGGGHSADSPLLGPSGHVRGAPTPTGRRRDLPAAAEHEVPQARAVAAAVPRLRRGQRQRAGARRRPQVGGGPAPGGARPLELRPGQLRRGGPGRRPGRRLRREVAHAAPGRKRHSRGRRHGTGRRLGQVRCPP
mmetsp:Transcript_60661/g.170943  ORF Transcript_60661/g.170943 Transcript_60661/m.170943 type:complete len:273 (-) Transcript_60661:57-875(-)